MFLDPSCNRFNAVLCLSASSFHNMVMQRNTVLDHDQVMHFMEDATILKKESPEEVLQQEILKRKKEEQQTAKMKQRKLVQEEAAKYTSEIVQQHTCEGQLLPIVQTSEPITVEPIEDVIERRKLNKRAATALKKNRIIITVDKTNPNFFCRNDMDGSGKNWDGWASCRRRQIMTAPTQGSVGPTQPGQWSRRRFFSFAMPLEGAQDPAINLSRS